MALILNKERGPNNDTTYALNRIPLISSYIIERDNKRENLAEHYYVDILDGRAFPITYRMIDKHQCKDK